MAEEISVLLQRENHSGEVLFLLFQMLPGDKLGMLFSKKSWYHLRIFC